MFSTNLFKFLLAFLLAGIIFVSFLSLVKYAITPSGEVLREWYVVEEGKKVTLPDYTRVYKVTTRTYTRDVKGPYKGYLVLVRPSGQVIKVYIGGYQVFSLGDENRAANFWNSLIAVPLNVPTGVHRLAVELTGGYNLGFTNEIYLTKNPWKKLIVGNFILSEFYTLSAGVSLSFSLLLILVGLTLKYKRSVYVYSSLSSLFAFAYMFDFVKREMFLTIEGYMGLKRFFYACTYLIIFFLYLGLEKRHGRTNLGRIFLLLTVFFVGLILFYPNFYIARSIHMFGLIFITFMLAAVIYQAFVTREFRFYWIFTYLGIVVVHDVLTLIFNLRDPLILGNAVVVAGIGFSLILVEDYKDLYQKMRKHSEEAMKDSLTGAYNRKVLRDLKVSKYDSVVFIDLDDLKKINDKYGHEKGDEILKGFVEVAKEKIRGEDVIIRYGGDEFIIILKNCTLEHAEGIAEKIFAEFKNRYGCDFSYGVSICEEGFNHAVAKADEKMYHMKKIHKTKGGVS